jgi:hypothetical protein
MGMCLKYLPTIVSEAYDPPTLERVAFSTP